MLEAITSLLRIAAETMGLVRQRSADKNTPEMKARAQAQDRTAAQDQIEKDVAKKDVDAVRKEIAE